MTDYYKDTVYRMSDSAAVLHKNKMWFNTCYLAGYVAECYCKEILLLAEQEGYHFHNASSVRNFSHKLDKLQDEVNLIAMVAGAASAYCIDVQTECPTIYANWDPNKRYQSNSYMFNQEAIADKVMEEMRKLMKCIVQMEIDGVLV